MNWMFGLNEDGEPVYTVDQLSHMFQMYQLHSELEKQKEDRLLSEESRRRRRAQENGRPEALHIEGDVISKVEPWTFSVDYHRMATHCNKCLVSGKPLQKCTACSFFQYCNKECQKNDWPEHKMVCAVYKMQEFVERRMSVDTKLLMLFLKVLAKLKIHMQKNASLPNSSPHLFFNLKINDALAGRDETMLAKFSSWMPFITVADDDGTVCGDVQSFSRIFNRMMCAVGPLHGKLCENTHGTGGCEIGLAIPLSLSSYTRSCMPNAVAVWAGGTQIAIKAVKNIGKDEPVTVGWPIDRFNVAAVRESRLRMRYLTCNCPACMDPLVIDRRNAVRCENKKCEVAIPVDTRRASNPCGQCGAVVTKDKMLRCDMIMKQLTEFFIRVEKKPPRRHRLNAPEYRQLLELYDSAKGLLHPTNLLLGMTHRDLAIHSRLLKQHKASIRFLKRMVLSAHVHLGKYDDTVITAMVDMFTYYFTLGKMKEGLSVLEETRKRMAVIPGEDSEDYKTVHKLWQAMQKPGADFIKYCQDLDWEAVPAGK